MEPLHADRPIPLSGTLWLHGATFSSASAPGLLSRVYGRLVRQAGRRVSTAPDADSAPLAHLLHGIFHGLVERSALPELWLPCFEGSRWPFSALLTHLEDRDVAIPELADDASPVGRELSRLLAPEEDEAEPDELEPEDTLARRLHLLLDAEVSAIRVRYERTQPLVALENGGLVVAGKHPLVRAVDAAVVTGAANADAKVALLAARLVSAPDDASELAWIERLLG